MRHTTTCLTFALCLPLAACFNAPNDDVGAVTYNVCCGAACCCPGGGAGIVSTGDVNPDNACEVCDPSRTASAWSAVPDCDAGAPVGTDAGPGEEDAGGPVPGTDAGGPVPGTDAGAPMPGTDAGAPMTGTDAGPPPMTGTDAGPGDSGGGDGCRAAPRGPAGPGALALLAVVGLLVTARRRRG